MNYDKLLLNELRYVTYEPSNIPLTEDLMAKAVTLNENLTTLGYTLVPKDIAAIATSPSLDGFYDKISDLMDEVLALPMYPGFPQEVMDMDEAVFRYHQMVHYFSTYGMELLFGVDVTHGWLPHENDAPKSYTPQERVLSAKTIYLLPAESSFIVPFNIIMSKRERMTIPEREIVEYCISRISPSQISGLHVGFKENMNTLYNFIFNMDDSEKSFIMLKGLCQHTGDVLRCIDILLHKHHFRFRTSQKRFLVKLLESYPVSDFKANLILSNKYGERNLVLLNYLDYSMYSKSSGHMDAVNGLRDGKLKSWNGIVDYLISTGDDNALSFIADRPGMMLRMIARLLRLGYTKKAILESLLDKADKLSTQTLVTNMNFFGKLTKEQRPDALDLYSVFESLLIARMKSITTPLKGKKVMISMKDYDLKLSSLQCNDKSSEGGYIPSGIAYRIPKNINRLRFFVYWNDTNRVDLDLHSGFTDLEGNRHCVGWNSDFRDCGVVHSGDITHSNAAEYIDIDLTAPINKVFTNINLFSGKSCFSNIETCFVGMMAVPDAKRNDGSLYSEANCFFKHDLRQLCRTINYGYIDVKNRCLIFDGKPNSNSCYYDGIDHPQGILSLDRYINLLLESQGATLCKSENKADVVLVMGKATKEKEVSLIDANFFMD